MAAMTTEAAVRDVPAPAVVGGGDVRLSDAYRRGAGLAVAGVERLVAPTAARTAAVWPFPIAAQIPVGDGGDHVATSGEPAVAVRTPEVIEMPATSFRFGAFAGEDELIKEKEDRVFYFVRYVVKKNYSRFNTSAHIKLPIRMTSWL